MHRALLISLAAVAPLLSDSAASEGAVSVGVCDLLKNPSAYDHKLVRVTGMVSFAFENFTLSNEKCRPSSGGIWLEFGGTLKSGAIPQGRTRARDKPLTVEGIDTTLVNDSALQAFDASIHMPPSASLTATLEGRYFAGKAGAAGVREWRGFGMWGMYSLLVIQQVISSGD